MTGPHISSWSPDRSHDDTPLWIAGPSPLAWIVCVLLFTAVILGALWAGQALREQRDFCSRAAAPGYVEQCRADVGVVP